MTWKPRHEAHAIERVRVLFTFAEPLPSKAVASASVGITDKALEFGFNSVEPAESSIAHFRVQQNLPAVKEPPARSGYVMRRHKDGELAEEVGFRDVVFGYMTTTYARWANMIQRLEEVLFPALDTIEAVADLDRIRLEYWDSFIFDGDPNNANVRGLLDSFETSIPKDVFTGSSTWHSHVGWFENDEDFPVLVNRNLDMVDRTNSIGETKRALAIYTLLERRSSESRIDFDSVRSVLEELHKRSLRRFGEILTKEYRDLIGLKWDT